MYVLYDPRDSVPLGHDGGGLPERDAVAVLPALDARCPPPLSSTCQESHSVNSQKLNKKILIIANVPMLILTLRNSYKIFSGLICKSSKEKFFGYKQIDLALTLYAAKK